jgi:hypothetical protein
MLPHCAHAGTNLLVVVFKLQHASPTVESRTAAEGNEQLVMDDRGMQHPA